MYFEASLHGLKFKASGGLGGWGGAAPHGLKKPGVWGGAQPPPFANRMLA